MVQQSERTASPEATGEPGDDRAAALKAFFDRQSLAEYLQVSTRTLDRLDAGRRLPPAVRIGAAKRWPRTVILEWVDRGCPRCDEHEPARRGRK